MSHEPLYNIVFKGRTLPGISTEDGIQGLARLTRKQPEEIARLFDGRSRILKRNVNRKAAQRFCRALKNAGLACHAKQAASAPELKYEKSSSNSPSQTSASHHGPQGYGNTEPEISSTASVNLREYLAGSLILALLLVALAYFLPNARSPMLAGLLLGVIFLVSYPCVQFIRKLLNNDTGQILLVSILFGGAPLVFFMCYGMVRGFYGLFDVKRYFKFYLLISCVLALSGSLFSPYSMRNRYGSFTDDRDGKTYKTIQIGDQVWMAENLAFKTGQGCYSGGDVHIYGLMYTYKAAVEACPDGWHIPTDEEWMTLINYLGGEQVAGKKLKSQKVWENYFNKNYGNNESGFSAVPAGFKREHESNKWDRELKAYYFSDTPNLYILFYGSFDVRINKGSPSSSRAYSVRCIRDNHEGLKRTS